MHLKSLALLFSLLLPVVVLSAPFAGGLQDAQVQLYALAVVVVVEPSPTGDFKKLLSKPPVPDPVPPSCKKEKKDWKKLDKKCKDWNILHDEFTNHVTPRVIAAIHAAESVLHAGAGPIHASVQSTYHYSAAHDDLYHWTFSFSAPGCGTGSGTRTCVGHAYDVGEVRQARIFSDDHRTIFNA